MGQQWSDDMTVVRGTDPVYMCSVVYCHRIDEGGDIGKFGRGHILGSRDMEN